MGFKVSLKVFFFYFSLRNSLVYGLGSLLGVIEKVKIIQ